VPDTVVPGVLPVVVVVVVEGVVVVVVVEGVVVVVVVGAGVGVVPLALQKAISALLPPTAPMKSGFGVPALYVAPFHVVSCFQALFGDFS
jgi:hypothetical protein